VVVCVVAFLEFAFSATPHFRYIFVPRATLGVRFPEQTRKRGAHGNIFRSVSSFALLAVMKNKHRLVINDKYRANIDGEFV